MKILLKPVFAVLLSLIIAGIAGYCCWRSYQQFLWKGLIPEFVGIVLLLRFAAGSFGPWAKRIWLELGNRLEAFGTPRRGFWGSLGTFSTPLLPRQVGMFITAWFLVFFPFSVFLHAVGLVPGILFISCFVYFSTQLSGEHSLHSVLAILMLGVFLWLWGEAGKPGLVVMPADIPSGRDDMEFTGDGVANAVETELVNFGFTENSSTYGDTEASKVLAKEIGARIFPRNPWYKGEAHAPGLTGLQASHVVVGTDVEGFPLSNVYHILRHLRGMDLLEAQLLIGNDGSLTLALRRSNGPLKCSNDISTDDLTRLDLSGKTGQEAVNALWKGTEEKRTKVGRNLEHIGCFPGFVRQALNWFDLAALPSAEDLRIANVTVRDFKGDVRLTTTLQLAALEAMPYLSNEQMAAYYDKAGKYESSFSFYRHAVSDLLREAHEDPPYLREFARQRLASALIRIGDYEVQYGKDCVGSDRAYTLAATVFPNDLHVLARIGYGYLGRAEQRMWGGSVCGEPAFPEGFTVNTYSALSDEIAGKFFKQSVRYLRAATALRADKKSLERLGRTRRDETLAWAEANLAYALMVSPEDTRDPKEPSDLSVDAIPVSPSPQSDRLPQQPWELALDAVRTSKSDLRAAVLKEYVRAWTGFANPGSTDSWCNNALKALNEIDPTESNPSPSKYSKTPPLTLHSNLVIEEQLQVIYDRLRDSCSHEFEKLGWKVYEHKFLFDSLLALAYIQNDVEKPERAFRGFNTEIQAQFNDLAERLKRQVASGEIPQSRLDGLEYERGQRSADISIRLAFVTGKLKSSESSESVCDIPSSINGRPLEGFARAQSLCARIEAVECTSDPNLVKKAIWAVNSYPDDPYVRANLGIVLLKKNDLKRALENIQAAVRLNPFEPRLRYLFGFALDQNSKAEQSREEYEYGRELDPDGWQSITQYFEGKGETLSPCQGVPEVDPSELIHDNVISAPTGDAGENRHAAPIVKNKHKR